MRILVVEDDVKVAEFVRRGLTEEGYAVDVLHDGSDAATERIKERRRRMARKG